MSYIVSISSDHFKLFLKDQKLEAKLQKQQRNVILKRNNETSYSFKLNVMCFSKRKYVISNTLFFGKRKQVLTPNSVVRCHDYERHLACFSSYTIPLFRFMDVLLNGHCISAKGESQSLCCMMGKTMSPDVTYWLLMIGD